MMGTKTQAVREDVKSLLEDARALMAATANVAEEKVVQARARLEANLQKRNELYGSVSDKIVASAKTVDKTVKENPYQAIGIAFGLGSLLGLLLMSRRNRD